MCVCVRLRGCDVDRVWRAHGWDRHVGQAAEPVVSRRWLPVRVRTFNIYWVSLSLFVLFLAFNTVQNFVTSLLPGDVRDWFGVHRTMMHMAMIFLTVG